MNIHMNEHKDFQRTLSFMNFTNSFIYEKPGGAGRRARRKLLALRIITELGAGDFLEHHAIARRRAFLPDVERVRHLFLRNGTAVRRKLDVAHTRKRHDQ